MEQAGLRERKKRRTRDALTDAAYTLFHRNGFDATTIDHIVDAVEVSPRTFFRYFTSKEDVALALVDQQLTTILERFTERPGHESVMTALCRATVDVIRAHEADADRPDHGRYRQVQQLLATSPSLAAASVERGASRIDEVARLVAARAGLRHPDDPRPHLVASVALCAVPASVNNWRVHQPGTPDSRLFRQAFDLLSQGLDHPSASAASR